MTTRHSALTPHMPGQGSRHLLLTHALSRGQSVFSTHSGRHPVYGSPVYSGKHVQDPAPFFSLQTAFAPHGEGLQGIFGPSVGVNSMNGEHPSNGSPVYPGIQEHTGECVMTTHVAWGPHDPGHGSLQRSFWHASFPEHSALIVHSGRQFGGRPM